MEDYFIIPLDRLVGELPIFDFELFALEYCQEDLDIPLHHIEEAILDNDGLQIQLKNLENRMSGDDWYVQLFRISCYSRAS